MIYNRRIVLKFCFFSYFCYHILFILLWNLLQSTSIHTYVISTQSWLSKMYLIWFSFCQVEDIHGKLLYFLGRDQIWQPCQFEVFELVKFGGQILGELSQLTSLEVLYLSSLFSYGILSLKLEKPNLTTLVQNLTQLRGLYLDNVNISAQKVPNENPTLFSDFLDTLLPGFVSVKFDIGFWSMSNRLAINLDPVEEQTLVHSKGQIVGLDLSNETISGGIDNSSVLFGLENLENLNLAGNKFNFLQIPSRVGSLISLKYLNLSNSDFSGQIPGELSQLTSLEVLDLSSLLSYGIRSLKLEKPNLTTLVQNLTLLKGLYLDSVNISAQKFDWCKGLSSSLPDLEILSLSNCQLSGPSLGKLKSLSIIRLALNNLSAPVPDFFADFKNLTAMHLGACNLCETFPEKVLQLRSLETLDLSVNSNLNGSLPHFPMNGSLRSLVLSNTNFSGGIPESIGNLKSLSRIELPRSNFSGRIPNSMGNLTRLSYLDLSSNYFIGQIPSFQLCRNLTHIDLSRNSLSGLIPSAYFRDLQNLVFVDLRFNAFSGSIPSSLFSLQLVQKIQLSHNNFFGVLADFSNASASLLDTLDLSSNKLEGKILRSFFQLGWLSILLLSSNKLSGKIETKDFQSLTNLTTLDLSFNNLSIITNSNTSSLSHLPMFVSLKLASCNLQKFPHLQNQARLMHLDLSSNKIEGEIPSWIWTVVMEAFHLHESIGLCLGMAYFFSISNNLLTGVIPNTICNASYLKVLDLSNNRLTRRIPQCFTEFGGNLGVLNLGKNSLSGRIKGNFRSSCGLNTLDLHGNSLEGKIPPSLVNCTMLEVLNLGNNRISGTYPCSLGNLTNLCVLVLHSNRFHGSVHCGEGSHNIWPKLQILDIALNNFTGAVPAD
ncbi:hypothetical protein L6452_18640 [Arctium lappa]|uniref:Uncharacterized protein n=1 Tax=Arctium lappa TaxID=4217 RepID=A0ACB9C6R3_ARCLA|nr:hypothetical protein L6452_18640 [Arctium lappa]